MRVTFNKNELKAALIAYAVANGGPLPNGPTTVREINGSGQDAAILEIRTPNP